MPIIVPSTSISTDAQRRFRSHLNWLSAFALIMRGVHPQIGRIPPTFDASLPLICEAIMNSGGFKAIRRSSHPDVGSLEGLLNNAWSTELVLHLSADLEPPELIGLANSWGVVQAYYACFHMIHALSVARNAPRPRDHTAAQRDFASNWVERRGELVPWALSFGAAGHINVPPAVSVVAGNSLATCDENNCWSLAIQALKSTREIWIQDKGAETRKRKNLKKLPSTDAAQIRQSTRPATLIDYLYRLRTRANYREIEMFTDGATGQSDFARFHRALREVVSGTLLLHELYIRSLVGQSEYDRMATKWISRRTGVTEKLPLDSRVRALQRA